MQLFTRPPTLTSQGAEIHRTDGYIKVLNLVDKPEVNCINLQVGTCNSIKLDAKQGFVNVYEILRYTNLLCTDDAVSFKAFLSKWSRNPRKVAIEELLIGRNRGAGQFSRVEKEDDKKILCHYVHPAFLLSITGGVETQAWIFSVAAFCQSFYQISQAFAQVPQDFCKPKLSAHIKALKRRVKIFGLRKQIHKHIVDKLPFFAEYPDVNWKMLTYEIVGRLSVLTRADLRTLQILKQESVEDVDDDVENSTDIKVEFLEFLQRNTVRKFGDLWKTTSAHSFAAVEEKSKCEEEGAFIVFPSGYIYLMTADVDFDAKFSKRTSLMSFENLLAYLPAELTCIPECAKQIAEIDKEVAKGDSKRASTAGPTKAEIDVCKKRVGVFIQQIIMTILLSPLVFKKKSTRGVKSEDPQEAAGEPQDSGDEDDEGEEEVGEESSDS